MLLSEAGEKCGYYQKVHIARREETNTHSWEVTAGHRSPKKGYSRGQHRGWGRRRSRCELAPDTGAYFGHRFPSLCPVHRSSTACTALRLACPRDCALLRLIGVVLVRPVHTFDKCRSPRRGTPDCAALLPTSLAGGEADSMPFPKKTKQRSGPHHFGRSHHFGRFWPLLVNVGSVSSLFEVFQTCENLYYAPWTHMTSLERL